MNAVMKVGLCAVAGLLMMGAMQGGSKSFDEPEQGYSMTYKKSFDMVTDKSFMEKVGVGDMNCRWFIFYYKQGSAVNFNPNLSLMILDVGSAAKGDTALEFMKEGIKQLSKSVKDPTVCIDPTPVSINGRDFYKVLYTHGEKGERYFCLQYCTYRKSNTSIYMLTATDSSKNDLKHLFELEKVVLSMSVED